MQFDNSNYDYHLGKVNAQVSKRNRFIAYTAIGLVIIVAIILNVSVKGINAQNTQTYIPVPQIQTTLVMAESLNSDYQNNEVAADSRYKHKAFAVKGTVVKISTELGNTATVLLAAGEYFQRIHCCDIPKEQAVKLHTGEDVIIYGQCSGLLFGEVVMLNCQIGHL